MIRVHPNNLPKVEPAALLSLVVRCDRGHITELQRGFTIISEVGCTCDPERETNDMCYCPYPEVALEFTCQHCDMLRPAQRIVLET